MRYKFFLNLDLHNRNANIFAEEIDARWTNYLDGISFYGLMDGADRRGIHRLLKSALAVMDTTGNDKVMLVMGRDI